MQGATRAYMETEETPRLPNAIQLDEDWEAYWIDKDFGWMLRCRKHPNKNLSIKIEKIGMFLAECRCLAPFKVWKKLLFLDKLAKM